MKALPLPITIFEFEPEFIILERSPEKLD